MTSADAHWTAELIEESLAEAQRALVERLEKIESSFHLHQVAKLAERLVALGTRASLVSQELHALARLRGQAIAGQLVLGATNVDYEVEFTLGDNRVRLVAQSPIATEDVLIWLEGYYSALVARDLETLHLLSSIHVGALREAADHGVDPPPPEHLYVLREHLLDFGPSLAEQVRTDGENRSLAVSEWDSFAGAVSLLEPVEALERRDTPRFLQSLARALEEHRSLWEKADDDDAPDGWVAWGPLALTCLAQDGGLTMELRSEYLPDGLREQPVPLTEPYCPLPWNTYTLASAYEELECCVACFWPKSRQLESCEKCGEPYSNSCLETSRMSLLTQPRKQCGSCGVLLPESASACSSCGLFQ